MLGQAGVVPLHHDESVDSFQFTGRDVPIDPTDATLYSATKAKPEPSTSYHDYSTIQIWIGGKDKAAVGDVIGSQLYSLVWQWLDRECPNDTADNVCDVGKGNMCWATRSAHDTYKKGNQDGQTCLKHIKGEWQNGPKRNLLIGAIAGTLEALTKPDMDARTSNCFSVDGKKGCNVGTPIRVNLPPSDGKSNFMYVDLRNTYDGSKKWDCCSDGHRAEVDSAIDGLGDEIGRVFKTSFSRDTKCMGFETTCPP